MPKDDAPSVVAYRVGQLEKTQKEGLQTINDKLDKYIDSFVAKTTFEEARHDADTTHLKLQRDIDELKKWKEGIINKIALYAVLFLIGAILVLTGLSKFTNVL